MRILDPAVRPSVRWQLEYARLFTRITDNSKILKLTGLKQEDMKPIRVALKEMFDALPGDVVFPETEIGKRMDEFLKSR